MDIIWPKGHKACPEPVFCKEGLIRAESCTIKNTLPVWRI